MEEVSIPAASMNSIIDEIFQDKNWNHVQLDSEARRMLHISAEYFFIDILREAEKLATHRRSCTIKPKDLRLACDVKGYKWK